MALFRMLEAENGSISVDGQDISHVQHEALRSALSAIPQDPVILNGSIRMNVDPDSKHSDEEVIKVLQEVGLWDKVKEKFGTDSDSTAGSLSYGQKQMLCIARTLLKKSTILVMDEATSR